MLLSSLGFNEGIADDDAVAILVGPNGCGKSNHLRAIALQYRDHRNVAIICNTAYDRFSGLRGVDRLSAGRGGQSPKGIIKRAVSVTLDGKGSEFYQISRILEYCGYRSRFGFRVEWPWDGSRDKPSPRDLDAEDEPLSRPIDAPEDFEDARRFLDRSHREEIIWIDSAGSVLEFSLRREFAAVLRNERLLRKTKLLRGIHVYLEKQNGAQIELHHASSGELSLISSLVFLITTVERNAIVIVDEPENSLHPGWQREYVDKVLAALQYRNASIIIATHAPLVVTGAITQHPSLVTVHQVANGETRKLELDSKSANANGIEEILWKAFEIVTPANHFVSEEIVDAIGQYERSVITKEAVLALVERMEAKSFDEKQTEFFSAIRALVDKVEARMELSGSGGRPT
jgi:predicted ATPase